MGKALVQEFVPFAAARVAGIPQRVGFLMEEHLVLLFWCWFVGSLLLALRFGGGWLHLRRVRRLASAAPPDLQHQINQMAERFGLSRYVRALVVRDATTPMAMGWLRPLLLVPVSLLADMDPVGLEALLAHELAHIRRHDYFVNVVQCVVEILLFYHPAVWWISRRVRTERELCCDDEAVQWCEDPLLYAETLTRLNELRSETLSPALAAGGGELMFRIKRLLIPALKPSTMSARLNLLALACSVSIVMAAGFSTNALHAQSADAAKWFLAGSNRIDYAISADSAVTHDGRPSQTIACKVKEADGFGTIMQNFVPTEFLGKRVRMSAWVKNKDVSGWAGLWMRVDGSGEAPLAFDNMSNRPIRGTLDWTRYEVVLDVSEKAKGLAFGLLLGGPGQAWLSDLSFAIVDSSVAVTSAAGGGKRALPAGMTSDRWFMAGNRPGDYATSQDPAVHHNAAFSHALVSKAMECKGFGTLMQMFAGKEYLGKRVRFTAWVKSENVEGWAGLWMRVDGPTSDSTSFDNMQQRAIKGSQEWKLYEVVLDVAADSKAVALGILMEGKGKVWMEEPHLEVVPASVPVTAPQGVSEQK